MNKAKDNALEKIPHDVLRLATEMATLEVLIQMRDMFGLRESREDARALPMKASHKDAIDTLDDWVRRLMSGMMIEPDPE